MVALRKFSKTSGLLNKIPERAALPVAAMIATGVARPKAQGQETTKTLMAKFIDKEKLAPITKYQTIKVKREMMITTGTKYEAIISAILAIGAFLVAASSTKDIILDNVVSLPTA